MRRTPLLALACAMLVAAPTADARAATDRAAKGADRIEQLQQELDSLIEDVEDLQEPVDEFALFEECAYLIGVTEYGRPGRGPGYVFGGAAAPRRPALALDIRGFGRATYQFLAFPAEEPPSIECNEDAQEEDTDDD
jgi:hypothetical protein